MNELPLTPLEQTLQRLRELKQRCYQLEAERDDYRNRYESLLRKMENQRRPYVMTPGPFDAEQGTSALPLTDEWKDCLDIIRGSSISDLFDNPEDENLTKEDLIIPPFLRKEQGDDS